MLDVRDQYEWNRKHIPGAVHANLDTALSDQGVVEPDGTRRMKPVPHGASVVDIGASAVGASPGGGSRWWWAPAACAR